MNACRHYLGLFPDNRPSCARGHNIREWANRCNNDSNFGIALRLPCTRQRRGHKHLFNCSDVDRKSDAEIDADREKLKAHADKIFDGMERLSELKAMMIQRGVSVAKAHCPWCGAKNKLDINCNIEGNEHIVAQCQKCGDGVIE